MRATTIKDLVTASSSRDDRESSSAIKNGLANHHVALEKEFAEYISGKSVAILGRGPSLRSCSADVVESYDIIVRVHRPAPVADWWPPPFVQPEWHDRVGTRTDVLYTSLGNVDHAFIERIMTNFIKEGGRFVCRPHPLYAMSTRYWSDRIESYMPMRYVSIGLYHELYKHLGMQPFPGTIVLADILNHNISQLFIGGMTCYLDASLVGVEEGGRGSKRDFNYIRSIWKDNQDTVVVDPEMHELFETVDESIPETAPTAKEVYKDGEDGDVNDYTR